MFKALERGGNFLGFTMDAEERFYFFGSRATTREILIGLFPAYKFCFLQQVHGHLVVVADPSSPQTNADAQYTSVPGYALVVQSADCLPLLLSSESQVCAIHASWRGVAQNIVGAVSTALPHFKPDFAAIGPHIAAASFEVDREVAQALTTAAPPGVHVGGFFKEQSSDKVLFDLKALVRTQLSASFSSNLQVEECMEDTKTDLRFHSYRRDGAQAARQYSFVVIKP